MSCLRIYGRPALLFVPHYSFSHMSISKGIESCLVIFRNNDDVIRKYLKFLCQIDNRDISFKPGWLKSRLIMNYKNGVTILYQSGYMIIVSLPLETPSTK